MCKLLPLLDLGCRDRGAHQNPQRAGAMEGGLPGRKCSCRGTQRLSVMCRWSREPLAQEIVCVFSLLPLESLAGASDWLGPVESHRARYLDTAVVGVSSLRARSRAEIIMGSGGGGANNQQALSQ